MDVQQQVHDNSGMTTCSMIDHNMPSSQPNMPSNQANFGIMNFTPNQLTYPVATAFPNQPNTAADGSVFWVPFVVSSPSPWSQSVLPPGTPFSPGMIQGSNFFRFDSPYMTDNRTPGLNQFQAKTLTEFIPEAGLPAHTYVF